MLREVNGEDATTIGEVQDLIDTQTLKCNLIYIKLTLLPELIKW